MTAFGRRLGVLVLLAIAAAVAVPALMVSGHAAYDHSTPNENEVVAASPASVDAFFKEEIRKQAGTFYLRVLDDSGALVSDGDGDVSDDDRTEMIATIPSTLADGRYTVHWQTVSDEDGDEASGVFCFYVVVQPTAEQAAECADMGNVERDATGTAEAALGTQAPEETPAATSGTPAATSEPAASPTTVASTDDDDSDSNTGIIIGIIVAVVAVVVVGGGVALYMRQQ